jgi:hypothetical protein
LRRRDRDVPELAKHTNAELLARVADLPEVGRPGLSMPTSTATVPARPVPFAAWEAERDAALALASQPTTISATGLSDGGHETSDAGLQKRPRDLDQPPWRKGRYGTAVGRAVHGVLQTIDLATGARVEALAAAQCEAEAIATETGTVRGLVELALASPSIVEAAASPHWREVYACTPVAPGRLLEGYVDLLYRSPTGLVVVDYKTAATADPAELDRRADVYRLQGAAYALTVGATTGEPVVRVTFLFLTPNGAVERHLPTLDEAVEGVRQLAVLRGT